MSTPLLQVTDLRTEFRSDSGVVRAVDGVSFELARGEALGIVGESGSGKSTISYSLMQLLPRNGRIAGGSVRLDGKELTGLPEAALQGVRGRRIAMIFQDPMTSLNPYLRICEQLAEPGMIHLGLSRKAAEERALALLRRVHIPDPEARLRSYPHELSGGMRQRVMIAMALLCDPEVLIADEPTTALDVTIQAQILELLRELLRDRKLSLILITHDLGVVSSTCDRVLVMYAGRVVESAPAGALFERPLHPYTAALLQSIPRLESRVHGGRLEAIQGIPPRLDRGPFTECAFAPRCRHAHAECHKGDPELVPVSTSPERKRRCVLAEEDVA